MVRAILFVLLLASPAWAQDYAPELEPLIPPERILSALGYLLIPEALVVEPARIDILCATASGVSTSLCTTGITRTTGTINNSQQSQVTVRLVKSMLTTYVSSGNVQTDLTRLKIPGDGHLDTVEPAAIEAGADTTVLIVKASNACGVAYLNPGFATSALAVVAENCITNYSFEHEWGHNIGMAHDLPNTTSAAYPYGYGWCFGNGWKDVLTYPSPCAGNRAAFYSNPDKEYQGKPTGTATANNARVLRERAATVAAFRPTMIMPPPRAAGGPTVTED